MMRNLLCMTAPVRDGFDIPCHEIGPKSSHPAVALVAGLHGDEINGVFILSRLADFLNSVEAGKYPELRLVKRVLIIPAVNVLGVNLRTRTWPFDKSDINRMFPGSTGGETTQRIAYAVLEATKRAEYRIDIHTASADFEEIPQLRLYGPSAAERTTARMFGLQAIMERSLSPVFTTTMMHSWKVWPGESFVMRVGQAGTVQLGHCQRVFRAMVSFLGQTGVLEGVQLAVEDEEVCCFDKESAFRVFAEKAGTFVSDCQVGRWVRAGQELGYIYDSFGGAVIEKVVAPVAGLLTGIRRHPLLFEGDLIVRVNRKA
ncbi:MAG: succinylglutamate desuccinylase/aspartoacylase family protein [Deltaproteobacteria bacterium]|nr:succinylglutamate desuccinylase/aspartoacylase family protein [Deltaproteobacteria bacterium]